MLGLISGLSPPEVQGSVIKYEVEHNAEILRGESRVISHTDACRYLKKHTHTSFFKFQRRIAAQRM